MSLFNRSEKTGTQVGDYRIEKVTNGRGETHYEVWQYDYGWEVAYWQPKSTNKRTLKQAMRYIEERQAEQEKSREVVWP